MTMRRTPVAAKWTSVPTYRVTEVFHEDAGHGEVRVWNCDRVNGVIIPKCEIIIHCTDLLTCGKQVADFAKTIIPERRAVGNVH